MWTEYFHKTAWMEHIQPKLFLPAIPQYIEVSLSALQIPDEKFSMDSDTLFTTHKWRCLQYGAWDILQGNQATCTDRKKNWWLHGRNWFLTLCTHSFPYKSCMKELYFETLHVITFEWGLLLGTSHPESEVYLMRPFHRCMAHQKLPQLRTSHF